MTEEEKENLKKEIELKMQDLKKTVADLEESIQPIPPNVAIGRLTRMEAINSKKMDEAALRAAKKKLMELERALKRINTPDFGLCSICKESIPYKRLMFMPETTLCADCIR